MSIFIAGHNGMVGSAILRKLKEKNKDTEVILKTREELDLTNQSDVIKVCAVQAPEFGDRRKLVLEDIAITTGGTVFSKDKGMKWDRFSYDWFGSARVVTVGKEQTTIVDGKGTQEAIDTRIEELQQQ